MPERSTPTPERAAPSMQPAPPETERATPPSEPATLPQERQAAAEQTTATQRPARAAAPPERATAPVDVARQPSPAPMTVSTQTLREPDARAATRVAEANASAEAMAVGRPESDLSGTWTLTNRIESTSYEPFDGLNVGFQLELRQEGSRVTGIGRKWMENGRPLPPSARTPIAVEGILTDGKLELSFTERGIERTSSGMFVFDVNDATTLSGTFSSDAANSQGTSLARRHMSPR
jgi:hypothetical protein